MDFNRVFEENMRTLKQMQIQLEIYQRKKKMITKREYNGENWIKYRVPESELKTDEWDDDEPLPTRERFKDLKALINYTSNKNKELKLENEKLTKQLDNKEIEKDEVRKLGESKTLCNWRKIYEEKENELKKELKKKEDEILRRTELKYKERETENKKTEKETLRKIEAKHKERVKEIQQKHAARLKEDQQKAQQKEIEIKQIQQQQKEQNIKHQEALANAKAKNQKKEEQGNEIKKLCTKIEQLQEILQQKEREIKELDTKYNKELSRLNQTINLLLEEKENRKNRTLTKREYIQIEDKTTVEDMEVVPDKTGGNSSTQTQDKKQITNDSIEKPRQKRTQKYISPRNNENSSWNTMQCFNCQQFGHYQTACKSQTRCVKCAGNHRSSECNRPRTTPSTCYNCEGSHPANYRGCPKFPKEERTHMRTNTNETTLVDLQKTINQLIMVVTEFVTATRTEKATNHSQQSEEVTMQ